MADRPKIIIESVPDGRARIHHRPASEEMLGYSFPPTPGMPWPLFDDRRNCPCIVVRADKTDG